MIGRKKGGPSLSPEHQESTGAALPLEEDHNVDQSTSPELRRGRSSATAVDLRLGDLQTSNSAASSSSSASVCSASWLASLHWLARRRPT
ncbi:UDP-glycosyltransferase 83A1 [Iris pallida]|uniref:UDP-glycosyltransferase 83A1 n=1 Tax=Iris pallida TaxID=29817 RepID=A0AAX6ER13_IRIPA|nr:UDP-glycosyltransferase 83A1 [Iris pallida]